MVREAFLLCHRLLCMIHTWPSSSGIFHITAIRLGLAGADPAPPSVPSHLPRSENPGSEKTVSKGNVRTKTPPPDPSSIARDPRKYSPVPETRPLFMCGSPVATFLSRDHITQILFPQWKYVLRVFSTGPFHYITRVSFHTSHWDKHTTFLTFFSRKNIKFTYPWSLIYSLENVAN